MNNMQKIKTNILFENRFVFYKRKEGNTWEEEKRDERGMGMAESVISEFEEYYRPNNLEVEGDHPDEIIHGVRDRMMQGPLGATNILSGGSILERRVYESLQEKVRNAPRLYRQMLNEAIRNGAPPLEVSQEMFSYDIANGGSYMNLLTNLQADIMGLGYIGPATFVDSQTPPQRINLANPTQVNIFERTTGTAAAPGAPAALAAPGAPGRVAVTIRWHQEDLTSIRSKLEQVGMWNDFSRQANAREFIHFKFRQSLILQTVWKEKTKLSKNKFDPQRLKYWLEDDLHQRALDDNEYRTWYAAWPGRTAPNVAALTAAQRNELARQQREARERVYDTCLEAKLKKILTPGQIESVTKSLETRTMLAYLFYKMQNDEDRENVENLIDELAGVDYEGNIETLGSVSDRINSFLQEMGPKMEARDAKAAESANITTQIGTAGTPGAPGPGLRGKITRLEDKINHRGTGFNDLITAAQTQLSNPDNYKQASAQIDSLNKQIEAAEAKIESIDNKISELQKEKTAVDKELGTMDEELVKAVRDFGDFINNQTTNAELWGNSLGLVTTLNTELATINGGTSTAVKIASLKTFLTTPADIKKAEDVVGAAKERTEHFERLKKNRPAAEKMDSRGLLYKLVKRDIEIKGATADPLIEEESLITTNILIAQARNQEIFGNVNQSIARRIEQGDWRNADEWLESRLFFSPIMTGAEAIEHTCDTDSDLNKLEGLNINSTPADMIRIMQQNRMVSAIKLRELQKKLSELLRGVDLEGRRIRIRDDEAPRVEKFINNLVIVEARLNAEERFKEVEDGFYDTSKSREQQVLQMLQQQTADSVDADERIAEDLESHDAKFKRFHLKSELKREYQEVMEQYEGLPKEEIEEELRRRGLTARVRSRGIFSLRAGNFLKKVGWGIARYGVVVPLFYDLLYKKAWPYVKSIVWTDIAKERSKNIRERYKGSIIEPVTTGLIAWPIALGSIIISRPKKWMRKVSDWASGKSKD